MRTTRKTVSVRILLVTCDFQIIETLCHFAQSMAVHIEACCDAEAAVGKLCHAKFEGVMVDLALAGGPELLRKLPSLTSNNSAISYAILGAGHDQAEAFQAGAKFVLDRPLVPVAVLRLLKAAYPFMVRERRRYYRCPLQIAVFVSRGGDEEFTVNSLNVSESGICLNSNEAMRVGDKLRLRLLLPGATDLLNLCGEVAWSAVTGRVGVRFSDVKPGVALVLRNWLAERLEENVLQQTEEVEVSF